jgi:FecR-like protein
MQRREVLTFLAAAAASGRMAWPTALRAQDQASSRQGAGDQIGQVATLQGSATVARGGPAVALRVNDFILKNDALETGVSSTLGVTFDDETTFSLSANTRITINEFVYQQGGSGNAALFTVARGTAAFLASKVASTGDMKIATPIATMGIRGTTGVVDVPEAGTSPGSSSTPMLTAMWGGSKCSTGRARGSAFFLRGRAHLRSAPEPAAVSRRSRSKSRRRKRYATAACCSGFLLRTRPGSGRRSNAGNRASATGNGPTSPGGPAAHASNKTFAASPAGNRSASRTAPPRRGRCASPTSPDRNASSCWTAKLCCCAVVRKARTRPRRENTSSLRAKRSNPVLATSFAQASGLLRRLRSSQ